MKPFIRFTLTHLTIFSLLVIGMLAVTFVIGMFSTLHPDAYVDGVMSIVYVYVIVLFVHLFLLLIKRTTRFDAFTLPKRWFEWYKKSGVFVNIALFFTAITFINNIMMLTGIDVPKEGTFAYTHLLVRTLIVTLAVVISMHRDVIETFKSIKAHLEAPADQRRLQRREKRNALLQTLRTRPLEASASLFTFITVSGCLIMVLTSPWSSPKGGAPLYLSLTILYGVLLVITLLSAFLSRRQTL